MRKTLAFLFMLLTLAAPASAQLGLSYTTFTPQSTISSAQFTSNFTNISDKALNRYAGVLEGDLGVDADDTYDLGSSSLQFKDGYFAGTLTIGAISCTTCIPETAITDGGVFPRLAANETYTGSNTFPVLTLSQAATARLYLVDTSASADETRWEIASAAGAFAITSVNDAISTGSSALAFTRSGTTIASASLMGNAISLTGVTLGVTASSSATFSTPTASFSADLTVTDDLAVGDALTVGGDADVDELLTADNISSRGTVASTDGFVFTSDSDSGLVTTGENSVCLQLGGATCYYTATTSGNTFRTHILPASGETVNLGSSGQRFTTIYAVNVLNTSDRRAKQDIAALTLGLDFLKTLKPKTYRMKADLSRVHYGFIAQDLQEIGYAGVDSRDPKHLGLDYNSFIAPMVKGIQELDDRTAALIVLIQLQQSELDGLHERIDKFEGKNRKAN
jgi:hypothetical protein